MTKRLWQLHSWLGLVCGLALLVVGVTGSILVFRAEIDALLAPSRTTAAGARLSLDELFRRVRAQRPGHEISSWWLAPDRRQPDGVGLTELATGREEWVEADPATGAIVARAGESFTAWLLDLHYALLAGAWGVFLVGLLAVALCLLGVSGVWLYRDFWRTLFRLRWRASARLFFSDLHKAVGISSVVFHLILGFTGAWWNLSTLPGGAAPQPGRPALPLYRRDLSIDRLLAEARAAFPALDLTGAYLTLPPFTESIRFHGAIRGQSTLRGASGSYVDFDPHSGSLVGRFDIRTAGVWTQCEDAFVALHFGTFGGLPVRILWCLGGLTPGALGVLGFLIWRARRHSARVADPRPAELTPLS